MHALNRSYRGKNRPTDVLSFSRIEDTAPAVLQPAPQYDIGDVVICLATAKHQAREYDTTLGEELTRLTVHGVLHCFGYDHERGPRDERIMAALEKKAISETRVRPGNGRR